MRFPRLKLRPYFSIRDLLWLILLAAIVSYAYRDRKVSEARIAAIKAETEAEKANLRQSQETLRQSQETLENKIASQTVLQKLTLISEGLDTIREYSAKCVITER